MDSDTTQHPEQQADEKEARLKALRNAVVLKRLREAGAAAHKDADSQAQVDVIPKADRSRPLPLSWSQRRLWFLDKLDPSAGAAYRIVTALRFCGPLKVDELEHALETVVARHEILRTRFVDQGGEPAQHVVAVSSGFAVSYSHLDTVAEAERDARLHALCREEAQMPFDLESDLPIRARLIRCSADDHVLVLTHHHLVSDGWSMGILANEVATLYAAYTAGQNDPLPPLPLQYGDYAAWQRVKLRGDSFERQLRAWHDELAGAPSLSTAPTDHARPKVSRYRGGRVPIHWPQSLSQDIQTLAAHCGATPFTVILSAWAVLLSRLSGQHDLVVGIPAANRPRAELEHLIGLFVDTLPIRVCLPENVNALGLIRSVHDTLLGCMERQEVPFDRIVDAVRPERALGHGPLFQTMVAFNNTPASSMQVDGLRIDEFVLAQETASQDLLLNLSEIQQGIGGGLTYDSDLFDPETVSRWSGWLERLLRGMVETPEQAVGTLPLLDEIERTKLLVEFNNTAVDYPSDRLVHELLEARAAEDDEAIALAQGDERISYGQLNRRANRIAHYLVTLGVKPDDRVAICLERGSAMVAGLLGILKAGAAYVPLDPSYPDERLAYMLNDSSPVAVLTQARLNGALAALVRAGIPLIQLDDEVLFSQQPEGNPDPNALRLHSRHLAYVIYTSGSTGRPKGVMVEHGSVVNFLQSMAEAPGITRQDVLLAVTTITFDIAALEIWLPLTVGAKVVMADGHQVLDHDWLVQAIDLFGITLMQATPSLWRNLVDNQRNALHSVRVLCGGEALSSELARKIVASADIAWNLYGPTETTIWSCRQMLRAETSRMPLESIGRPIANTRIYILDPHLQPVPLGMAGEICIGGAGVARGYLNRAELTAERFMADPFSADPEARIYKTGDLGRYRSDGTLEFLGRNDFQVKVRGFRIELGEIESALQACSGVRDAVVVARGEAGGERTLVAYWQGDAQATDAAALRSRLQERLPGYMVPAAYVQLEHWPMTPNGKLDRSALPAPHSSSYVRRAYEAPQGAAEMALAEVWSDVLGMEQVGRHDNFFELGGDSMQVLRLIEPLQRAGWHLQVRDVFSSAVLASLAKRMRSSAERPGATVIPENRIPVDAVRIEPAMLPLVSLSQMQVDAIAEAVPGGASNIQDIYPLAPLQEGILFHHLMQTRCDMYLLRTVIAFAGRWRMDDFLRELQATVDRHDILRTVACWENLAEPVQVVLRRAEFLLDVLSPVADEAPRVTLETATDPSCLRLDLRLGPLLRAYAIPDGDEWLLALVVHHFISDHITVLAMVEEIGLRLAGAAEALPPAVPFRNFVARARMEDGDGHETYFRLMLGEVVEPTVPFGVLDVRDAGASAQEARLPLREEVALRLRRLSRVRGVPASAFLHAAWAMVLAACTGREDVVTGSVLSGRMHDGEGAARALGVFINTLPLRITLGDADACALLDQTHRRLGELLQHEQASLALAQRCSGIEAPLPLFTALLNVRHVSSVGDGGGVFKGMRMYAGRERSNYPLTVSVDVTAEAFVLVVLCAGGIDAIATAERYVCAIERLLDAVEREDPRPARTLPILPQDEFTRLVYAFNDTAVSYRRDDLMHSGFERHARTSPDAIAVLTRDGDCTYRELNVRANRIAHRLLAVGIRPGQCVAICAERGIAMIAALLGILKAGGAYVPLDPAYPPDRLSYMLEDSLPVALIADRILLDDPEVFGAMALKMPVLYLDDDAMLAESPEHDPDAKVLGIVSTQLAYVIYTSGSTGLPKGVMVQHRPAINLIEWVANTFDVGAADTLLFTTSLCFDLSVYDIFGILAVGGKVRVAAQDEVADPRALVRILREERITFWDSAPAVFSQLMPYLQDGVTSPWLRLAFFSGDWIPLELPGAVRRAFPCCRSIGLGGATEAVVWSNFFLIERVDPNWPSIPYGRPIQNARYYVLDAALNPVPEGVPGDLYIGGECLSSGYFRREALTAERYLPDPFDTRPRARMYRTGDRARHRGDGQLEFLGRLDSQVKIRGFRIELGEVEAQLLAGDEIRAALVDVREFAPGDCRLVAYVIPADAEGWSAVATRDRIAAHLPEYMLPSAFVPLASFPLNVNGKIDRGALPETGGATAIRRPYEAPANDRERLLAEVWATLLNVERVGRLDTFFELGGHSLIAITLIERLRQAGYILDVRAVFEASMLMQMAQRLCIVDNAQANDTLDGVDQSSIPVGVNRIEAHMLTLIALGQEQIDRIVSSVDGGAGNVQDIYPLAPLQEGILFHHLFGDEREGEGDTYLLRTVIAFDGRARIDAFLRALQRVIDRHDILRTALYWEGLDTAVQVVRRKAKLPVLEHGDFDDTELARAALVERTDPDCVHLDLSRAPLLEAHLARAADTGEYVLSLLTHHAVCDHVSLALMMREVTALLSGSAQLPSSQPYRRFIAHALSVPRETHMEYFRGRLEDVIETTAPFGTLDVRGTNEALREASVVLPQTLCGNLRARALQAEVLPAAVFHLAWAHVLSACIDHDEVVFGTVLSGRLQGVVGSDRAIGVFINTLPIRARVEDGVNNVDARLRTMQSELNGLLEHEQAPLSLAQRCSGIAPPMPLFTTLLNYRRGEVADSRAEAALSFEGMRLLLGDERTNYPIAISVDDTDDGFLISAQCAHGVNATSPERLLGYFTAALEALAGFDTASDTYYNVLPAAERRQVLETFNASEREYPPMNTIHEAFEMHAAAQPDAVAIEFGEESLSYRALNLLANRVAHTLVGRGVKPDDRVGLCAERSLAMAVGLLGILKAGAAYVPLDPTLPATRVQAMAEDSGLRFVLTHEETLHATAGLDMPVLCLDDATLWSSVPETNPDPAVLGLKPEHLAYIIYTSGSTGMPKGAMNQHDGVCNRLQWAREIFGLGPDDCVLQKTPFGFDVSVWEFFLTWSTGARLVLARPDGHQDPEYLAELIERRGVTVLHFVPSMLDAYLCHARPASLSNVRAVLCSGEALSAALRDRFLQAYPEVELHNLYGPTEAAVDVTWWSCAVDQKGAVPIGRPAPNVRMYVLDGQMRPVPLGVEGELYIGGVQVGRGYLNRPALTAERFMPDPFVPGGRLYRTGDLGRWREDGVLEYLGRNDFQVKVRGYRIELGEIESALRQCAGVREAAVSAHVEDGDNPILVAYVEGPWSDLETLRAEMTERLPRYMIPGAYVRIETWPLSANGKLDRKRLPVPQAQAYVRRVYEAPTDEAEVALAEIWSDVLGVPRVGRHDNFFELGGDSIRSIAVVGKAREKGLVFTIANLFKAPTVAELARVQNDNHCPAGTLRPRPLTASDVARLPEGLEDAYPAMLLQQGMIFYTLLEQVGRPYHDIISYKLELPQWREACMRQALHVVTERHPALRSAFGIGAYSEPLQFVYAHARIPLQVHDLREFDASAQKEAITTFLTHERTTAFDLERPPLCRITIHRLAERRIQYTLSFHHAVLDGWSVAQMQTELFGDYLRLASGEEIENTPSPAATQADAIALEQAALDDPQQAAFWRQLLDGFRRTVLPAHDGVPVAGIYHSERVVVADADEHALRSLAQSMGLPVQTFLLTAHLSVLASLSGNPEVTSGLVCNVRPEAVDGDRALGLFLNTLPLRINVESIRWRDLVMRVRQMELAVVEHRYYPYFRLHREPGGAQLFDAIFNYVNFHVYEALDGGGVQLLETEAHEWSGYPLDVTFEHKGHLLVLEVDVDPARFSPSQARQFAHQLISAISALVRDPDVNHVADHASRAN